MSRNVLRLVNPDGTDSVTYANVLLERAPDAGGTPGVFAQIASIAIDTSNEQTAYVDTTGATTSWYKHRYEISGGGTLSDYTTAIQFGDYVVRQRIKTDIPDTDITNTMWDQWRDRTVQDMHGAGLGRPAAAQSITPTSNTTEFYNLNAEIRRVVRVDVHSGDQFVATKQSWYQWGRQLRLVYPLTTLIYKIYGIAQLRGLVDMDDELQEILYWGMRLRYIDFRINERMNFRPFLARTRGTDTGHPRDFQSLKAEAQREWDTRVTNWRQTFLEGSTA